MKKVLVVAAHSDDPVIGMGATLKKFSQNEFEVIVVSVCGDRLLGFDDAMDLLGVKAYNFEFSFSNIDESILRKELENLFRKIDPALVFTHWYREILYDHEIVSRVVCEMARKGGKELFMFEIPASSLDFNFNVAVDVSDVYEYREKAIMKMKEAFDRKVFEEEIFPSVVYPPAFRGIQVGVRFAEVFYSSGSRHPLSPRRWALGGSFLFYE
ncbi:MAG: hypothetical protein J7L34_05230 [Thermotogaceae bacterium]|nr:hypothetical protein [Thermotogaceae bacterium]